MHDDRRCTEEKNERKEKEKERERQRSKRRLHRGRSHTMKNQVHTNVALHDGDVRGFTCPWLLPSALARRRCSISTDLSWLFFLLHTPPWRPSADRRRALPPLRVGVCTVQGRAVMNLNLRNLNESEKLDRLEVRQRESWSIFKWVCWFSSLVFIDYDEID